MSSRRFPAVAISTVFLLAGCTVTDQYDAEVESVGKQIVADWKELPEVVDAEYEYRHGLDQGQVIYAIATVEESAVQESAGRLEEIARRDYWRGTAQHVDLIVSVYSEAKPRVTSATGPDNSVSRKQVELDDPAELEARYGPRPTRK